MSSYELKGCVKFLAFMSESRIIAEEGKVGRRREGRMTPKHIHLDCATKHAKPRDKAICSEFRFIKLDQYELCAEKCIDG